MPRETGQNSADRQINKAPPIADGGPLASDAFDMGRQGTGKPTESHRSKYAKISREDEQAYGVTIKAIREAAQTEAEAAVQEADPGGKLKPLEREQFYRSEWKERARANPDFIEARDKIALAYTGLADAVTDYYRPAAEDKKDMSQATRARLIETVENYQQDKGDFSPLGYMATHQEAREVIRRSDTVYKSDRSIQDRYFATTVRDRLATELQREPTMSEIADEMTKSQTGSREVIYGADRVSLVLSKRFDRPLSLQPEVGLEDAPDEEDDLEPKGLETGIIPEGVYVDPRADTEALALDRVTVHELLKGIQIHESGAPGITLDALVQLTIFDKPQGDVADELGVTKEAIHDLITNAVRDIKAAAGSEEDKSAERVMVKSATSTPRPKGKMYHAVKEFTDRGITDRNDIANALGVSVRLVDNKLVELRKKGTVDSIRTRAAARRSEIQSALARGETPDPKQLAQAHDVARATIENDIKTAAAANAAGVDVEEIVKQSARITVSKKAYSTMDHATATAENERLQTAMAPNSEAQKKHWQKIEALKEAQTKTDAQGRAALQDEIKAERAAIQALRRDPQHVARRKAREYVFNRLHELDKQNRADQE